ncbi:hypothetical protein ATJ97_0311 [Georgenia soli]|uniref:Uncharacterized protein n=1 Tax=Georgenia soli TaxID=638953 RepID=A0A2A9EFZ5_9MICO|nr:hypothetical protein [Georgenia soli]PFG37848.1 hypothetical protein ATJ97_0311 [Georgenia soli]
MAPFPEPFILPPPQVDASLSRHGAGPLSAMRRQRGARASTGCPPSSPDPSAGTSRYPS